MPQSHEQQRDAAAKSARLRITRRLSRDLRSARPLTQAQRAELIAAAAAIPVIDAERSSC